MRAQQSLGPLAICEVLRSRDGAIILLRMPLPDFALHVIRNQRSLPHARAQQYIPAFTMESPSWAQVTEIRQYASRYSSDWTRFQHVGLHTALDSVPLTDLSDRTMTASAMADLSPAHAAQLAVHSSRHVMSAAAQARHDRRHALASPAQSFGARQTSRTVHDPAQALWIALGGGPCGAKSTTLQELALQLQTQGWVVHIIEEVATQLLRTRPDWPLLDARSFQTALLRTQLRIETETAARIALHDAPPDWHLVLVDRPAADGACYCASALWAEVLRELRTDTQALLARYDMLFHLHTLPESLYVFGPGCENPARSHSYEQAVQADERHAQLYHGRGSLFDVDDRSHPADRTQHCLPLIQVCLLAQQRHQIRQYEQMLAQGGTDEGDGAVDGATEPEPEPDSSAGLVIHEDVQGNDRVRAIHIGERKVAVNGPNHDYLAGTRVGEANHPGPSEAARQRAYEHAQYTLYALEQQHQQSSKLQWLVVVDAAFRHLGPDPMGGYAAEKWFATKNTLNYAFLDAQDDVDMWNRGIPDDRDLLLFVNSSNGGYHHWLHKYDWQWWLEQENRQRHAIAAAATESVSQPTATLDGAPDVNHDYKNGVRLGEASHPGPHSTPHSPNARLAGMHGAQRVIRYADRREV
jgi:hypothetical protein